MRPNFLCSLELELNWYPELTPEQVKPRYRFITENLVSVSKAKPVKNPLSVEGEQTYAFTLRKKSNNSYCAIRLCLL